MSIGIAAASKVTFELVYEELLKRQLGKFELLLKVQPKQLVKHFQVSRPGEGWGGPSAVVFGHSHVPSEMLMPTSLLSD